MLALQVLPFLGCWLSRRRRLNETQQVALVTLAGVSYFSLTLLVTWQALRAQPLLNPVVLTAGAFLALVAVTGSIALLAVAHPSELLGQPGGAGRSYASARPWSSDADPGYRGVRRGQVDAGEEHFPSRWPAVRPDRPLLLARQLAACTRGERGGGCRPCNLGGSLGARRQLR